MHIRLMNAADIPAGLRLVEQAGWNQLARDWERFLKMQPDGCFVAEMGGNVVGTTVACLFDRVAWLAMVLVEESHRGQGLGTALIEHALAFCDVQGMRSVRLDATPLGQPLYAKFGFLPQFALTRYAGQLPVVAGAGELLPVPTETSGPLMYDAEVTRTFRHKFLEQLFADELPRVFHVGWITIRRGRQAWQLGPCLAKDRYGETLLNDAAARLSGEQVYFDTPDAHAAANRWAKSQGLVPQRSFVRMCRGVQVCESINRLWASSGPELG